MLTPPVYFDHGDKVFFGKHFYANTDLTILDENYVRFGDNVFLAPHVSIYTAGHPIDAKIRNTIECNDYEAAKNLILYYSKIKGAELTKGDEYESKTYTAFRR